MQEFKMSQRDLSGRGCGDIHKSGSGADLPRYYSVIKMEATMATIFDLRNVSYSYVGKIDALKDITLKIDQGEQVSIIGSNGSGEINSAGHT